MNTKRETINLNYNIEKLFSVPIHYLQLDDFERKRDLLIEYAYNLKDKCGGRNASNYGGWQSQPFEICNHDDILHDLLINVISSIPSFQKNIDIKCDAWVNINPAGSFNVKHCHPNCDIAGVLWIKIPKNSGNITFISPYDFLSFIEMHSYTDEFKKDVNYYHTYEYPPQEGAILMFPSHLQHKVGKNESNEDRISISFNIKLLNVNY